MVGFRDGVGIEFQDWVEVGLGGWGQVLGQGSGFGFCSRGRVWFSRRGLGWGFGKRVGIGFWGLGMVLGQGHVWGLGFEVGVGVWFGFWDRGLRIWDRSQDRDTRRKSRSDFETGVEVEVRFRDVG